MESFLIAKEFEQMAVTLARFSTKENFELIEKAGEMMTYAFANGNKILACGNGGSMADAIHLCEELTGRFRGHRPALPALAISDPGHLSCTANDYGYEQVFSRYIEAHGKAGDVLVAISVSGNSPNVLRAAETARNLGMKIIALSGNNGGKLSGLSDLCLAVESAGFADRVQEIHIKIIHTLIYYIEQKLFV